MGRFFFENLGKAFHLALIELANIEVMPERVSMNLTIFSPVFAIAVALCAFSAASLLELTVGPLKVHHRISALDGLRGFLVIGVFVHHASFWIVNITNNEWLPHPGFYNKLGQTCVGLFFMITAFLFYGKLLKERGKFVDWQHIAISRILRLTPMYIFMVAVVFSIALILQGGLIQPAYALIKQFLIWLPVGLGHTPDVNALVSSWTIMAGVTWTLPYEWLFYFSLPLLALMAGVRPKWSVLLIGTLLTAGALYRVKGFNTGPMSGFLSGIIAAYAFRRQWIVSLCCSAPAAIVATVCLTLVLFIPYESPVDKILTIFLSTVGFVIIACGNNLLGLLTLRGVRALGDMGYSVYLLHGIFLYVAFHSKIGKMPDIALHPIWYWGTVSGLGFLLVIVCRCTFCFVEQPAMNLAGRLQTYFLHKRVKSAINATHP